MRTDTKPLRLIADTFADLTDGPEAVTIDGHRIAWLPDRPIDLRTIAAYCADRQIPPTAKDQIWAHLVDRSRQQPAPWVSVCAGLALPGLRNAARRATWHAPAWADWADIESTAICGFTAALADPDFDLERPRIARRLCNRAFVAARRYAIDLTRYQLSLVSHDFESHPPEQQFGHPDFVLADLVRTEAITVEQADILGETYLGGTPLKKYAEVHGISESAACRLRQTAKRKVTGAMRETSDGQ